jgi:IclR family transcriptional regulator, KDG regulon repressor
MPLAENHTISRPMPFAVEARADRHDEDTNDARQPESVAAVLRVFAVLQALSEEDEMGLTELSVKLAMPKATVYRFLQTMKTLGYVRQVTDSERYGLTMRLFELGTKALQYPNLVDLARHRMEMLAEATGETVHLGTLIDSEIIYVHKVDSKHMLGMYSKIGRRAPLHNTAIGKVLMAWEHPQRRELIMQGMSFTRFRDRTITTPEAYRVELERTRLQGYGEDREEFDEHIRCVGVPIFDRLNHPVAGLSVSTPTFRFDEAKNERLVALLTDASREISAGLGCTDFPLAAATQPISVPKPRR